MLQVLQPRCELCTHVDPAPKWQCVGRTVDFLAEGRTVPAGGARLYAAVTPHYPDAAGNTWVTRCAGCCLATDVRNFLQEYTLQVPARQALRQAVDIFERRHVYRVPGPPPEVREQRNVGDDGAGPPPPPLEAPEASVDEFGRKWTCTLHTNPDWDVTDPLGRASRAAPRDSTPPTPHPSNVDSPPVVLPADPWSYGSASPGWSYGNAGKAVVAPGTGEAGSGEAPPAPGLFNRVASSGDEAGAAAAGADSAGPGHLDHME